MVRKSARVVAICFTIVPLFVGAIFAFSPFKVFPTKDDPISVFEVKDKYGNKIDPSAYGLYVELGQYRKHAHKSATGPNYFDCYSNVSEESIKQFLCRFYSHQRYPIHVTFNYCGYSRQMKKVTNLSHPIVAWVDLSENTSSTRVE